MLRIPRRNNFWERLLSNSALLFSTSITQPFLTSPLPSKRSETLNKLYQRDWLSPQQFLDIFKSADPTSVLTLLLHASTRKDFKPNESLYSLVIAKLAQSRNFDAIDQLMAQIKAEKRCRLSDEFFHGVIRVYGNVGGKINSAIETLTSMPMYDCWPSVKTFNFVLNLLVCSRQFGVVREVYLSAGKLGVEIDSCSLNIVIKGMCENGCLESALKVLDEFPQQGCRPNEMTFSTIINGFCEHGKVEEAFGLVERMEREGVWPDTIIFNSLIKGLRKQGRVDEAVLVLDKMRRKGCNPNSGSLQQVLYGLIEVGRCVEAKEVMRRMISRGWKPSFVSFKMLFVAVCEEGLLEDGDWVLKEMVRHGFVPRMGMWCKALEKMSVETRFAENNQAFLRVIT